MPGPINFNDVGKAAFKSGVSGIKQDAALQKSAFNPGGIFQDAKVNNKNKSEFQPSVDVMYQIAEDGSVEEIRYNNFEPGVGTISGKPDVDLGRIGEATIEGGLEGAKDE